MRGSRDHHITYIYFLLRGWTWGEGNSQQHDLAWTYVRHITAGDGGRYMYGKNTNTERDDLNVSQPKVCEIYYTSCAMINMHNIYRQDKREEDRYQKLGEEI